MTNTSSSSECGGSCAPKGLFALSWRSSTLEGSFKTKVAKLGAGFIGLCAVCCVTPSFLIALGLIGASTAAYVSVGLKAAMIIMAALGTCYLFVRYLKYRR